MMRAVGGGGGHVAVAASCSLSFAHNSRSHSIPRFRSDLGATRYRPLITILFHLPRLAASCLLPPTVLWSL